MTGVQKVAAGQDVAVADPNLVESAARFFAASRAPSTVRAYASDWARFERWCERKNVSSLPASSATLALYLADAADAVNDDGTWSYSPVTLTRWVAAINAKHRESDHLPPGAHDGVSRVLAGIKRTRHRKTKQARALRLEPLRKVIDSIPIAGWPQGIKGRRDSLMLLLGFAGAFRQSEIAGLVVGDISLDEHDGMQVLLRRSKGDQVGEGQIKAIPFGTDYRTCVPCAFVRWRWILRASHGTEDTALPASVVSPPDPALARMMAALRKAPSGKHVCRTQFEPVEGEEKWPLFEPLSKAGRLQGRHMTGEVVHRVVKERMKAAGLDPRGFSGHSLRAGFVTEADAQGASVQEVMRQTGHRSPVSVEDYVRHTSPLQRNAVTKLGL